MPELDQDHGVLAPQCLEPCDSGAEFGTNLDKLRARRSRRTTPRCRRFIALFGAHSTTPSATSQSWVVKRLIAQFPCQAVTCIAFVMLKTIPTERTGATTNVRDRTRRTPMSGEAGEAALVLSSARSEWRPSPKRCR